MKILTIVYSLEKGGTQRAAQNFAVGYLENGFDSRILVTRFDGVRRNELEEQNIHVWLGVNVTNIAEITAWGPNVVHIHSHGLYNQEVKSILGFCKNSKIIETNVFSIPSPWAKHVDNSYQLSEWCLWLYKRRGGKNLPSNIVPNPVVTNNFSRQTNNQITLFRESLNIQNEDILLGRVGQHYDSKWSTLLIDIYDELKIQRNILPCIKLLVVNPPKNIVSRIDSSPFKQDIIVLDSVIGDSNLAVVYSAIDIFTLIADQGESFGMVLAEAMLCETPVVALSTPWADNSQCEVVGNNVGGLIASTPKGFKNAIEFLIKNNQFRKNLGASGRRKIIKDYNHVDVALQAIERIDVYSKNLIDNQLPQSYFNTWDTSPKLPQFVLKGFAPFFIRYYSGYQSINQLLSYLHKIVLNTIKQHIKDILKIK